jgi:hypothetical protein
MSCDGEDSAVRIYRTRDNAVSVIPYSDLSAGTNYDLSDPTTRILTNADVAGDETVGNSVVGDSAVDPLLVYWDDDTLVAGVPQWRIYCKVGLYTGIVAETYTLRITIFDAAHPNGLVLPDTDEQLLVIVEDLP